jgi:hypothetical protein
MAVVVGIVSLVLVGFGILDVLRAGAVLAVVVVLVGGYGFYQVLRTPLAIVLDDGVIELRGLARGRVRVEELARVRLQETSSLRPDLLLFVRKDGTTAFSTDAGLWRPKELQELLQSIGVALEGPAPRRR